jgi:hypothetical protein
MFGEIITLRVKQERKCIACRPVVAFESIAGRAAVNEILRIVSAASRARLKMIHFQFAARLFFPHVAIAASKVVCAADSFFYVLLHIFNQTKTPDYGNYSSQAFAVKRLSLTQSALKL